MDQENLQEIVVGVLGIQGSVEEHVDMLGRIGVQAVIVKDKESLSEVQGLIMPGGESTTIGLLLRNNGLDKEIQKRVQGGMPVWGTCAGAILLAKQLNGEQAFSLELMNIAIERNAYGRQTDSFETEVKFDGEEIPAVFIRAPKIADKGEGVEILALDENEIVAAREENMMVTTFHPELSDNEKVHRYFVGMIKSL